MGIFCKIGVNLANQSKLNLKTVISQNCQFSNYVDSEDDLINPRVIPSDLCKAFNVYYMQKFEDEYQNH